MSGHGGSERDRACDLFESTQGDTAQAVFFVDDFTLFSDPQPAINCPGRRAEDGDMSLAAAATDGPAPSVK